MTSLKSLTDLYTRYKGAVFGYLYRMTGSATVAEELTQETFYQAVLSLHRFRGDASVSTWLLKVGRNVYLKSLRRQGREVPQEPALLLADAAAPALRPEDHLLLEEARATVQTVLAQLPETPRTALILREVQGLSHREIAVVLEKTEPTVRVLIHRARERFRELYLREENKGYE
jgi:RNA polymerase sigma-70 factor (ECF subfamily)